MATVVTIAQQKGGAGKTSLAAHLATTWAYENGDIPKAEGVDPPHAKGRVTLIDLDPQQSLATWFRLREELHGTDSRIALRSAGSFRIAAEIEKARKDSDLIVIDSPPHAEDAARAGIRLADLVIVPLQLSPMDIWAARPTFELIVKERRKALFVFNRVPSRARMAESIAEALKKENLPIANAALGNRIAFASSLMRGQGVVESDPRSTAADEMRQLALEVMRKLQ
jgi:chromosome partitioning protein